MIYVCCVNVFQPRTFYFGAQCLLEGTLSDPYFILFIFIYGTINAAIWPANYIVKHMFRLVA